MSRDLRLLAGAVFLSAAGDLLALIVLALQVHELTGSGLAVSALFATTLVPVVALAPLAGLVADRVESVRVLVVASLAQALVAVALAFSSDLAAILALSSLLTAGSAFGQPAEFALIPAVAGSRTVTEATGIVEAARYAGFAAGPLLAAGLATLGPQPALLVNAASFLAIAAAVGAMRARRPPCAGTARGQRGALEGFRLLRRDRVLRVTIAAAVGALLFISASLTVEIFYLKDVVGASDTAYALLVCAWMAGMVGGGDRARPPRSGASWSPPPRSSRSRSRAPAWAFRPPGRSCPSRSPAISSAASATGSRTCCSAPSSPPASPRPCTGARSPPTTRRETRPARRRGRGRRARQRARPARRAAARRPRPDRRRGGGADRAVPARRRGVAPQEPSEELRSDR